MYSRGQQRLEKGRLMSTATQAYPEGASSTCCEEELLLTAGVLYVQFYTTPSQGCLLQTIGVLVPPREFILTSWPCSERQRGNPLLGPTSLPDDPSMVNGKHSRKNWLPGLCYKGAQ